MRHVNTPNRENVPYKGCWGSYMYTFKNPTKNRSYVKVLKFVEKHPGCKRKEILKGVWGTCRTRGSNSTLFSQMLYNDILDYNKKFEYRVTRKGKNILKKVK